MDVEEVLLPATTCSNNKRSCGRGLGRCRIGGVAIFCSVGANNGGGRRFCVEAMSGNVAASKEMDGQAPRAIEKGGSSITGFIGLVMIDTDFFFCSFLVLQMRSLFNVGFAREDAIGLVGGEHNNQGGGGTGRC